MIFKDWPLISKISKCSMTVTHNFPLNLISSTTSFKLNVHFSTPQAALSSFTLRWFLTSVGDECVQVVTKTQQLILATLENMLLSLMWMKPHGFFFSRVLNIPSLSLPSLPVPLSLSLYHPSFSLTHLPPLSLFHTLSIPYFPFSLPTPLSFLLPTSLFDSGLQTVTQRWHLL